MKINHKIVAEHLGVKLRGNETFTELLEIEKGEMIHTHTINCNKTLSEVEDFAFDQINKLIEEEKKQ